MHDSQPWKEALTQNGWVDAYQSGPEFQAFLRSENDRVAQVLGELGLA